VQPGDVGAQLADLGDQGLGLSHSTSISALTPMSTTPGGCLPRHAHGRNTTCPRGQKGLWLGAQEGDGPSGGDEALEAGAEDAHDDFAVDRVGDLEEPAARTVAQRLPSSFVNISADCRSRSLAAHAQPLRRLTGNSFIVPA
jgi:hypothetical protein